MLGCVDGHGGTGETLCFGLGGVWFVLGCCGLVCAIVALIGLDSCYMLIVLFQSFYFYLLEGAWVWWLLTIDLVWYGIAVFCWFLCLGVLFVVLRGVLFV